MGRSKRKEFVEIPVRRTADRWELIDGGEVLVRDGAIGKLVLRRTDVRDTDLLNKLGRHTRVKVAEEGEELLVALGLKFPDGLTPDLLQHVLPHPGDRISASFYKKYSPDGAQFVKVTLGEPTAAQRRRYPEATGGLWLEVAGLRPKGVITSRINVPAPISEASLISLNHAFTRLSEVYEPWRLSHTGNIYSRVLYQELNGLWYPLEALRSADSAGPEHERARGAWEQAQDRPATSGQLF